MRSKISGARARRWRREVAGYSQHSDKHVRSLKFPLDTKNIEALDFSVISGLYEVTEGVAKGSLAGLLYAVHLSGFRFFGSATKAELFLNSRKLPTDEFIQGWKDKAGVDAKKLSPETVITLITKQPRSAGGQAPTYESKSLASGLYQLAVGKRLTADKSPVENVRDAFLFFESLLKAEFPDRVKVADDPNLALQIFDSAMATRGFRLPSLEACYDSLRNLTPPSTTIVYDASMLTLKLGTLDDTAIHSVIAQKLGMLVEAGFSDVSSACAELQEQITTQTNNALSWLFGNGFIYWRSQSIDQIMLDYDIPRSKLDEIQELKAWFEAVPEDSLFGSKHYSDFRSSIGGKLDSWIANYCSRLDELSAILDSIDGAFALPKPLFSEQAKHLFSGTGLSADQLKQQFIILVERKASISGVLDRLVGRGISLPVQEDVLEIEEFSDFLDGLAGVVGMIKNQISQESENSDTARAAFGQSCSFDRPKWLKRLPRINRISGGVPSVLDEVEIDQNKMAALRSQYQSHVQRILDWSDATGTLSDPLVNLAAQEQVLLVAKGCKPSESESQQQARRKILHRLVRLGINGSRSLKENIRSTLKHLFVNPKNLNQLLFSNLGTIYRSPFSRSRHSAYDLDETALLSQNPGRLLRQVRDAAERDFKSALNLEHYRDWIRVESLEVSFRLSGLPPVLPSKLMEEREIIDVVRIPVLLKPLLKLKEIQRDSLIRIINLYTSEMSGVLARLFRQSFTLKTKFVRVDKHKLYYVPKKRDWTPPQQYLTAIKPIGALIRDLMDPEVATINPSDALSSLLGTELYRKDHSDTAKTAYLSQAPHDWFIDLEIPSKCTGTKTDGLSVGKKGISNRMSELQTPCRLIGASSYKTELDTWLGHEQLKLGEYNLMFLQHYKQNTTALEDGSLSVEVVQGDVSVEVALTITDKREVASESHPLAETIIGIDLGEAGIGFAVFETGQANNKGTQIKPLASGTIPVRSIRNLIKAVKYHRGKVQPNQRFQQRQSNALEQLRDNVVGDLAHVIDSLCWKYRGFPVLESSVRNLASGAAQLKLVYDRILNLYLWTTGVDAHKQVRKHHWCGGESWEHPTLYKQERKQQKDGSWKVTGKIKPLIIQPGSGVPAARTSQTCSQCNRNPIAILQSKYLSKTKFDISASGEVNLPDGDVIVLLRRDDTGKSQHEKSSEIRANRRKKLIPRYQYPEAPGKASRDDILAKVRRQMRQPQLSSRSKDTTQSRYACVYRNCRHDMHADENAAINIVRKWVGYRGISYQRSDPT